LGGEGLLSFVKESSKENQLTACYLLCLQKKVAKKAFQRKGKGYLLAARKDIL
jgi:hypothetical protein